LEAVTSDIRTATEGSSSSVSSTYDVAREFPELTELNVNPSESRNGEKMVSGDAVVVEKKDATSSVDIDECSLKKIKTNAKSDISGSVGITKSQKKSK
jgi:mannose/fructose/N-acetylgalactosamine-specific phosphotransferase system component IIB